MQSTVKHTQLLLNKLYLTGRWSGDGDFNGLPSTANLIFLLVLTEWSMVAVVTVSMLVASGEAGAGAMSSIFGKIGFIFKMECGVF